MPRTDGEDPHVVGCGVDTGGVKHDLSVESIAAADEFSAVAGVNRPCTSEPMPARATSLALSAWTTMTLRALVRVPPRPGTCSTSSPAHCRV